MAANLHTPVTACPSGAAAYVNPYSDGAPSVVVTGNNCTLSGFNFCNPAGNPNGVNVFVTANVTGTVINNSKFCNGGGGANFGAGQSWIQVCGGSSCGASADTSGLTLTNSEFDGLLATSCSSICGGAVQAWVRYTSQGPFVGRYNYCHNVAIKCYFVNPQNSTSSSFFTYQYNLTYDIGMQIGGDHADAIFYFTGDTVNDGDIGWNVEIAKAFADTGGLGSSTTANWSIGDPATPDGVVYNNLVFHNNLLLSVISSGASNNVTFGGGCSSSSCDPSNTVGNQWSNNYFDPRGTLSGAYYNASKGTIGGLRGFGGTSWFSVFSGNKRLDTGVPCGTNYFSSPGTTSNGDGGSC